MFVKSNLFTNFAPGQLFLDFSNQIVRCDKSSVHVQGSNALYDSSRIQITPNNSQNIPFLFPAHSYATNQKLYE